MECLKSWVNTVSAWALVVEAAEAAVGAEELELVEANK